MSETKSSRTEVLDKLQVHAKPIMAFIQKVTPHVIIFCQKAHGFYKTLPADELRFLIGAVICFFGGMYPVLFAAIEAAKHGGLSKFQLALKDLADEALTIIEASKKDDDADDDNDGKKDVDELDTKQLVLRKVNLVLKKMNPQKVNNAIETVYSVWLAVVAVLALQFARTIAFAESIYTFVKKPIARYASPKLLSITPDEYKKWVPILILWVTKMVCVSIAFSVTSIVAAVTASLSGALMMTHALMKIAVKKKWAIGDIIGKDEKDTILDEYISYAIAFMGFYFQWKFGFGVPFPLNFVLFPFGISEQFLRWSIGVV